MDEKEIAKRTKELEKLKVHPKDISENRLILEKLKSLYEEAPTYMREQLGGFIRYFDSLLERQEERAIKKYRKFLEQVLEQMESYDPFEIRMEFEEYEGEEDEWDGWEDEEDAWDEEDEGEDGRWTS